MKTIELKPGFLVNPYAENIDIKPVFYASVRVRQYDSTNERFLYMDENGILSDINKYGSIQKIFERIEEAQEYCSKIRKEKIERYEKQITSLSETINLLKNENNTNQQ